MVFNSEGALRCPMMARWDTPHPFRDMCSRLTVGARRGNSESSEEYTRTQDTASWTFVHTSAEEARLC